MQDLKVAIIQTNLFWQDKETNLKHIEQAYFKKLRPENVDLIVLPEMFNTGFTMEAASNSETLKGSTIKWLKKWAKYFNCFIGGSLIITANRDYYNRFVIVNENGIVSSYNKRHLFRMASEHKHFTPGLDRVVVNIKGWNLMLQVCYDLRFPAFVRNRVIENDTGIKTKEYDAIIYVANWPEKRGFVWRNLIQARAIENQVYCIGVNRVGQDGNEITYSGDSMLVDPWGNISNQLAPHKECMETVILEAKKLETIKELFPAYLDADHEILSFDKK